METGLESFKAAVTADCAKGNNCFSENGCTEIRYAQLPEENPRLIEMGITSKCVAQTKCTHDYCGKYMWTLERAAHYADKTGLTIDQVMEIWETDRSYWYMNYYQDAKQPLLNSEKIINYNDWINGLCDRFGTDSKKWAFRCPHCGNTQTAQEFIEYGIDHPENKVYHSCIGRYVKDKGCDWSLHGLFQIHKLAVMKDAKVYPVFEMAEK